MPKILVVDDEAGIVEEVKSFFEEEGYAVLTADTARSGIEQVIREQPDVLILDIKLPDASGLEVLKISKQQSPRTKVIVNTGYVDQRTIDEAERLGRDCFLPKPFNLVKLKEEVDALLDG
jgi:DNA-binding NtrC family response regulator